MKDSICFRDYKSSDFDEVIKLWNPLDLGRPERGDNDTIIQQTLKNGGKFLIMEYISSKEIIGTSWITNDGRRLYLHHFGIKEKYQGLGLSKLLLEKSLIFAKETGLQIKLEVHKNNIIAKTLYNNYGFNYLGDYEVHIIREY